MISDQTTGGGAMALQETVVGGAIAFVGSLVLAIGSAVLHLFFRVVRLETQRESDKAKLDEISTDIKKLLIRAGIPVDTD